MRARAQAALLTMSYQTRLLSLYKLQGFFNIATHTPRLSERPRGAKPSLFAVRFTSMNIPFAVFTFFWF